MKKCNANKRGIIKSVTLQAGEKIEIDQLPEGVVLIESFKKETPFQVARKIIPVIK